MGYLSGIPGVRALGGDVISAIMIVLLAIGVFQCFFGYKIFRVLTAIVGFLTGGAIGAVIGAIAMKESAGAVLGFLLIGILGAWLAYTLYKLSVFLVCFFDGTLLTVIVLALSSGGLDEETLTLAVIVGVIAGIIGVILIRPIIILSTAVSGGMAAGSALSILIGEPDLSFVLGIICVALGCFYQFKTTGNAPVPAPGYNGYAPVPNNGYVPVPNSNGYASVGAAAVPPVHNDPAYIPKTYAVRPPVQQTEQIVLVKNESPLWTTGCPVFVTKANIVRQQNEHILNLELRNLSAQPIVAVEFSARCFNSVQQELKSIDKQLLRDYFLEPDQSWVSSQPLPLLNPNTARIDLVIHRVAMADGSAWYNETDAVMTPYAPRA